MKPDYYFDDEEIGLSSETSHPNFVQRLTDEFYYDCTDEFSPFGNDDGADALAHLSNWYKESGNENIISWLFDYIDGFGFKYQSEGCSQIEDEALILKISKEDPFFFSCMDNMIIAAAFGQYKIMGKIEPELKKRALIAIKRLLRTDNDIEPEFQTRYKKIAADLETI